jgi:hypothetical protein
VPPNDAVAAASTAQEASKGRGEAILRAVLSSVGAAAIIAIAVFLFGLYNYRKDDSKALCDLLRFKDLYDFVEGCRADGRTFASGLQTCADPAKGSEQRFEAKRHLKFCEDDAK